MIFFIEKSILSVSTGFSSECAVGKTTPVSFGTRNRRDDKTMEKKNAQNQSQEKTVNKMDEECDVAGIRQSSHYTKDNKPLPDNNMFFEERHNPLSSKGN